MSVALCFLSSLIQKEVMRVWETLNGEEMIRLHGICKLIIGLKKLFFREGITYDIPCTKATLPYFDCSSAVRIGVLEWVFVILQPMLEVPLLE